MSTAIHRALKAQPRRPPSPGPMGQPLHKLSPRPKTDWPSSISPLPVRPTPWAISPSSLSASRPTAHPAARSIQRAPPTSQSLSFLQLQQRQLPPKGHTHKRQDIDPGVPFPGRIKPQHIPPHHSARQQSAFDNTTLHVLFFFHHDILSVAYINSSRYLPECVDEPCTPAPSGETGRRSI